MDVFFYRSQEDQVKLISVLFQNQNYLFLKQEDIQLDLMQDVLQALYSLEVKFYISIPR